MFGSLVVVLPAPHHEAANSHYVSSDVQVEQPPFRAQNYPPRALSSPFHDKLKIRLIEPVKDTETLLKGGLCTRAQIVQSICLRRDQADRLPARQTQRV